MKINYSKTKEMILGLLVKSPPDLLSAFSTAHLIGWSIVRCINE